LLVLSRDFSITPETVKTNTTNATPKAMLKAVKNEANLRYRRFRKAIDKRLIGQLFPDRKIKKSQRNRSPKLGLDATLG
jgi:hypothetical protein